VGEGREVRKHQDGLIGVSPDNKTPLEKPQMKLDRRKFLRLGAGTVALPAIGRRAWAEAYPTKPIRLIVPVPPAGTFDIVARLVSNELSQRLGQQIVIENRGGAGTNLGTGLVAHSTPDGYTLLLAGSPGAINATVYTNLDFNFAHDIAPVASIERAPIIMVVNPSLAPKTVTEFISYTKANTGKVNMGSGGVGSTGHVAGELFNLMAGLKVAHVPYRGEAPAITDLLGGQVQVVFSTPGSVMSAVKAGTLRALGVTGSKRMDVLPDVPAIAETLPGYEAVSWAGIGAPANTPVDIIDKLNKETNACLADAKLKAQLGEFGAVPMTGSPADFGKFIAAEIEKWAKVVKFANIKAE
jgi:tripartite-type tricarboxylate transporter receptor subunit TctC